MFQKEWIWDSQRPFSKEKSIYGIENKIKTVKIFLSYFPIFISLELYLTCDLKKCAKHLL